MAVVGCAQTTYGIHRGESYTEMVFRTVTRALEDAGMEISEIDTICHAGNDLLDGKGISHTEIVGACGGYLKEEVKVEEDGLVAAFYAYVRILSSMYKTALVFGYSKASGTSLDVYSSCLFEPIHLRQLGMNDIIALALQAQAYQNAYGVTEEDAACVVVKNHANGAKNPLVLNRRYTTLHDVLGSPYVSYPLRELDLPPPTDGCCAMVFAESPRARKGAHPPVWILGVGNAVEAYPLGHRDPLCNHAVQAAAHRAYRMSGISDPSRVLDLIELSEPSSYHELILYESLGLAEKGKGKALLEQGTVFPDGSLPVNLSGGSLAANPLVASGLVRLAEVYLQLSGRAGIYQLPDPVLGLAHGHSGICMQSNTIFILERD